MPNNENIGALWLKQSKNGANFLSGNIDFSRINVAPTSDGKVKIVVFKRKEKTKETQPDYDIILSKPRDIAQEAADVFGGQVM